VFGLLRPHAWAWPQVAETPLAEAGLQADSPCTDERPRPWGGHQPRAFASQTQTAPGSSLPGPFVARSTNKSAYGPSAVTSADGCMLGRSNVEASW
jgi:hypothetical protein